jgi:hypothetical protein
MSSITESQPERSTSLDRQSDQDLRASLRKGNLGERRRAFAQEVLRRRAKARESGRSKTYLFLLAVVSAFGLTLTALSGFWRK